MDNLTHSLVGVLVGDSLAEATPATCNGLPREQRRNLFVTLMVAGGNLPDLDFIQSALRGDKLDYLLQHRGYTHTVVGALIMAALMLLASEAWCRWRRWTLSRSDRLQIAGLCTLALLLHVAMDFTNNYGVHPFWPFYNGWLYGDSIFIWEPLLWTAAAPLVFTSRTRTARILVAALIATAIAVCIGSGLVPIVFVATLITLALGMLLIGYRASRRTALIAGVTLWLSITAVFAVSHGIVERRIERFVAQQFPQLHTLDRALTPNPANPVCWDLMLTLTDDDHYLVRHGTWSLVPSLLPAERCPGRGLFKNITAPVTPMAAANTAFVFWHGELVMPRQQLRQLAATYCQAAAFLRFARVPWTLERSGTWIVGDLRYDREPELGFAEIELHPPGTATCPAQLPPWTAPRKELLSLDRSTPESVSQ